MHGFFSDIADYRGVEDDRFVVAILGASVAGELATVGKDALTRSLTRATPYPRGRAEVLNLASAGYKQPQQVAVLAEMVILGVPLDVVVNLDGFNETALGGSDARAGFHPFFPFRRQYGAVVELSRAAPSGRALELAARVASERRRARELQAAARYPILRSSELAQAVAGLLVRRAEAKAVRLEVLLQSESAGTLASKAVADLPAPCLARGDGCGELIADLWARSSLALHALAREAGAAYLHVLQPTQGKIMSGLTEAAAVPGGAGFHAGTKFENGQYLTTGGRVLGVCASAPTLAEAMGRAYEACGKVYFEAMDYRRDIGAIKEEP